MTTSTFLVVRFHRIQRKRQSAESGESMPSAMEKAEMLRAKERMTLKHTKMAKWAKRQLSRGAKDPAVCEHLVECNSGSNNWCLSRSCRH